MSVQQLASNSLWLEHPRPRFSALKADGDYDVVVIGGGITGLTAAYLLKQAGQRVALLEKGRIGGGETGHTTAHLTQILDWRLTELQRGFGQDGAQAAWHAGAAAVDMIERVSSELQIDCQFQRVPSYLHARLIPQSDESDSLREEALLARELGFEAEFLPVCPLFERPCVRVPNQAIFHPVDYIAGLARAVHGDGCAIHEHTEATEFTTDPAVMARGHELRTRHIVIATHVPLVGLSGLIGATLLQTKIAGYSTYAIGAVLPSAAPAAASLYDTSDPYYYTRIELRGLQGYVVFGGEDHKTGIPDGDPADCYARLEELLLKFLPGAVVDHRWSGQVLEPSDGLPYIGPTAEQQFVATGFSGSGMTLGTIGGMLASDWVLGRSNPWQELFSVDRKPLRTGLWEYLSENVSYPYHLAKGWLTPAERTSTDSLASGEGRILKLHGQTCAVSRTADGQLQACSAICTHMGCIVRWNGAEQTWDCPCHGSRFMTDGTVMAGPAETPLAKVEL